MTATTTELLVIGAGPFGLAMAAHARHLGLEALVVGEPMGFWKTHMPKGMYLRSACDWHLDPDNIDTIEAYLGEYGLTPAEVEPLSLERYLDYAQWFQARKQLSPRPVKVETLDAGFSDDARFIATLEGGGRIVARSVVLALGFQYFAHVPEALAEIFPIGRATHTCDMTDFSKAAGRRWLIVGGRQSAFEWAALMAEAGAAEIHVVHRHDSPRFATSDWSWVTPLVDALADNPGWFRALTTSEREAVNRRLWAEGRLKLEPWLAPRVSRKEIALWPNTVVTGSAERADGALEVRLSQADCEKTVAVDGVVMATGYKPDLARVPMLHRGNILSQLQMDGAVPALDDHLHTSLPGLYITSMPATAAFGPFFAFTVSARVSARLIGRALTGTS